MEDQAKGVLTNIRDIFGRAAVFYSSEDVEKLIAVTNLIYDRGHHYSYEEVAQFCVNQHNKPTVEKYGLNKFLDLIPTMKMPPIRRRKFPGRNEPCPCESGKKFKACCWGKQLAR
jgi:uncharacterized protein YecA (UPF0149 family)